VPIQKTDLKGLSLELILNQWTTTIEQLAGTFHQRARQIADWDKKIVDTNEKIDRMAQMLTSLKASQKELEGNLDLIDAKQSEMHSQLATLEAELDKLDAGAPQSPTDAEREQSYIQAERINTQLSAMAQLMKDLVERLNRAQDAPAAEADQPVMQVVQILNAHLNSLQWLDQNVTQLTSKLGEVERQYRAASSESQPFGNK